MTQHLTIYEHRDGEKPLTDSPWLYDTYEHQLWWSIFEKKGHPKLMFVDANLLREYIVVVQEQVHQLAQQTGYSRYDWCYDQQRDGIYFRPLALCVSVKMLLSDWIPHY